jgi:hypothetical protein
MEKIQETYEKQLEAIGERMGLLMQRASDEQKILLRKMKKEVEDFAKEEETKGNYLDRSALFAAGIIANPEITNDELKAAAKEYIEVDYHLLKSYKDEEGKK